MFEEVLLQQLKELNETVAKFNRSHQNRLDYIASSSTTRVELEGEIAKFLRQSIILLPPEASGDYCSKCGKKL